MSLSTDNKPGLNLIWQTKKGGQTDFEFEYTTEVLFKNYKSDYYFDHGSFETIKDNSVIIYSNDCKHAPPEFIHYLNKFVKRGFRFYLLHYSNENLGHDCWYYSKANYVFRNYFDPQIKMDNVCFIPLGFKTGYFNKRNTLNVCTDKTIDISFIGQAKSDRFEMITEINKINSYYFHKTNGWNCNTALTQDECIEIYKKTKYVTCPMGNVHQDSFRLCESLEWGCVPIVKTFEGKDYFQNIFGNHPFKVVNDWREIADIIKNENYCQSRELVFEWYSNFKIVLQLRIQNIIDTGGIKSLYKANTLKNAKYEAHRSYRQFMSFVQPYLKKVIIIFKQN